MGVEPRIGQLAARVKHLAARLLHRLADARVHARRVIRLRLLDVRGDIRAVVHGFLLGDKLQHKRARQNRLRLERFQRPIPRHLPGQHGGQIILDGQGFQRLAFHVVNPEHRHAGFVFAQPLRHELRRARPLRLARGALRLRQGGLSLPDAGEGLDGLLRRSAPRSRTGTGRARRKKSAILASYHPSGG